MKFLVPYYSCLQNPWLGGYRPQIPVFCPQLNLLNPPTEQNTRVRHWFHQCSVLISIYSHHKNRRAKPRNLPKSTVRTTESLGRTPSIYKHLYRVSKTDPLINVTIRYNNYTSVLSASLPGQFTAQYINKTMPKHYFHVSYILTSNHAHARTALEADTHFNPHHPRHMWGIL